MSSPFERASTFSLEKTLTLDLGTYICLIIFKCEIILGHGPSLNVRFGTMPS